MRLQAEKYVLAEQEKGFKSIDEIVQHYKGYGANATQTVIKISEVELVVVSEYEPLYEELEDDELYALLSDEYSKEQKDGQLEAIKASLSLGNSLYERSFEPREDLRQTDEELESFLIEAGFIKKGDDLTDIAIGLDYEYCEHCSTWAKDDGEDFCYCQTHTHDTV
jgi:hypothetical protein